MESIHWVMVEGSRVVTKRLRSFKGLEFIDNSSVGFAGMEDSFSFGVLLVG